jgi:hypothetical protein
MQPILTRCGNRCDLCLFYAPNVTQNPPDFRKLSDGFFKYYGFRLPTEPVACDGCMAYHPNLLDTECPVRPCVLEKGYENCSRCEQYICDRLKQRLVVYEEVRQRSGTEISPDDYVSYIQPYENKLRLDKMRE